ncbi:MAG TPA: hypothetical protein VMR62_31340 [Bryobacteraceae bacterium]|jgi:hypothetical protein|nr:hypothetical protein [Bryobacteraceae bacterium]
MRNNNQIVIACGAILLTAGICVAQGETAKPAAGTAKYFHLEFVVKELDGGKVTNARHYTTTIVTGDHRCTIRSGNKVPLQTGGTSGLTYVEVGVNIDGSGAKEIDGNLALDISAEISNVAAAANPPLIRQTKWNSNVLVPIGKPTVIASSDDVASKGQMQLELTATPIPAH